MSVHSSKTVLNRIPPSAAQAFNFGFKSAVQSSSGANNHCEEVEVVGIFTCPHHPAVPSKLYHEQGFQGVNTVFHTVFCGYSLSQELSIDIEIVRCS